MIETVLRIGLALGVSLLALTARAEPVAMATDVRGTATIAGSKAGPVNMLHYFDAPTTVRLASGSQLSVTYFANPVQYTFKGPALVIIDAIGPKVSEGAPPETRRVGPEKAIDGGLTKDQWRRLQQATVVMRSSRLAFTVISPNQTTLLTPRAELSWTPAAGAQGYRVSLHDEADTLLATWTSASPNSDVPASTRLEPGKSYRWKVEPVGTQTPLTASGSFAIASPETERRLTQARPADPADLAANVYFATLLEMEGLAIDAKREWKRLARLFPDEAAIQRRAGP